jgi:hypothetical protein
MVLQFGFLLNPLVNRILFTNLIKSILCPEMSSACFNNMEKKIIEGVEKKKEVSNQK